jgi:hypothetical protein
MFSWHFLIPITLKAMIHACGKVYWIRIFIGKLDIFPWNIRSVCYSHAPVYWSIRCKTHYDITDKNNNVSFEDRHYHKYPWTRLDISDNVCLDLQNCCYSVYVTKLISKSRRVGSFLQSIFIFWLPQPVTLTEILLRME